MFGGCRLDAELMALVPVWKQRLLADPQALPELEREVQIQFIRGADLAVFGLVSWVMQQAAFGEVMDRTRLTHAARAGTLARSQSQAAGRARDVGYFALLPSSRTSR